MYCPVCGTLNEDGVPFCGGCGAKMMAQQPIYQQPAYQQPIYQQPVYQQPPYRQPPYQPIYQQPAYQQPVYPPQWQPMQPFPQTSVPGKGMGLAGMILGIASIMFCMAWVLSGICAVLAIVFSALAQSKARKAGRNNGMAIAGLICGGIGLALTVLIATVSWKMPSVNYGNYVDVGMEHTENL